MGGMITVKLAKWVKRWIRVSAPLLLAGVLAGSCAGPPPAPVQNRSGSHGAYESTPDGYYRVRRGDSLHAIAFKFGLDWREIARLNGISSPYTIYPDQVLRLSASRQRVAAEETRDSSSVRISSVRTPASATTRNVETPVPPAAADQNQSPVVTADRPANTSGKSTVPVTQGKTVAKGTQAPAGSAYSTPAGDPDRWLWPTEGKLLSRFRADDPSRKGIDIGGRLGQSVVATAAGQVVYSGSGLIGYGELIIIKHSDRMLSAYAHNSKRMVSEGQHVRAGSQIAEMGTNDRNQALLHFEIRVNGTPRNPLDYLPGK